MIERHTLLTVTLDGTRRTIAWGRTILDVAREAGVRVPTLCHHDRLTPSASCGVCTVEVRTTDAWRLVPACETRAEDGMEIRSSSERVLDARRWALELLASDHDADCKAPCVVLCPAGVKVLGYTSALARGRVEDALAIVRRAMPLPSVCGRLCHIDCENACHRDDGLDARDLAALKRGATEAFHGAPLPAREQDTGRRVAVVGAGPAALGAAWWLRLRGHTVTVFFDEAKPAQRLRQGDGALPERLLDADLDAMLRFGISFRGEARLPGRADALRASGGFDAACDTREDDRKHDLGVAEAIGRGRRAAGAADAYLRTGKDDSPRAHVLSRQTRLRPDETALARTGRAPATVARQKCLQCGCEAEAWCELRSLWDELRVDPTRLRAGPHRQLPAILGPGLHLDMNRCIRCTRCTRVCDEEIGARALTVIGRGFDSRIHHAVLPGGDAAARCLSCFGTGAACVALCPTGALTQPTRALAAKAGQP